jgi:hypothetical protein
LRVKVAVVSQPLVMPWLNLGSLGMRHDIIENGQSYLADETKGPALDTGGNSTGELFKNNIC